MYISCVSQSSIKLFFAIAAVKNKVVLIVDTTNAYQQIHFLKIDEAYQSWYQKQFGKDIDPELYVIPLGRALQGHPKAGALWERMIVDRLESTFGFKLTTHEQNIYSGEVKGETCHCLRFSHSS